MATTFKTFLNNDIATTRTLLHEAIPVTGTIISGTYNEGDTTTETNIKTYAHGMFETVYDYPYLSSSANHILDITVGYAASSSLSSSDSIQNAKKINVYNEMAQVLVPYDISGNIQGFDQDGNISGGGSKFAEAFFVNFARLLTKDEIKKGSFEIDLYTGSLDQKLMTSGTMTISDYGASDTYKVNSPSGEYGLLYTSSATANADSAVGHVYYQAGIAVITSSVFSTYPTSSGVPNNEWCYFGTFVTGGASQKYGTYPYVGVNAVLTGSTMDVFADGVRRRIKNIQFNNTTELNSTIYFCRANTGDFNYSANPTYTSGSKILVKGNNPFAEPVSYITTIGLYSADNELLAVAKLSEPLKKTPSNELTLRVRLDY
tara:strand:+ start:197 stop:1318 length:1122 start_codon:yes stop_codon:yes gene_type:complete